MTKQQMQNYDRLCRAMETLGFDSHAVDALLKCSRQLSLWAERECGDSNNYASWAIERDEKNDKPYVVTYWHDGRKTRRSIPDLERSALNRAWKIIDSAVKGLQLYHQTDPRGCSLYLIRPGDIPEGKGMDCYYTNGIAICI